MDSIPPYHSDRQRLEHELDLRAVRHATWLALREAQRLGLHDIVGSLTSILVLVDGISELGG